LMRFVYVALFVIVFAAALLYFKHSGDVLPDRPELPVEARVELYVPGMT
jgi:hypothetical protein